MSRDVAPIFADIDGMDADKFISHLTPDVRFRFANMDPAIGHAAVKEGVEGFWSTIDGLTHHIQKVYEVGDTVIAQIDVEYRRKDGKSVTVPNCPSSAISAWTRRTCTRPTGSGARASTQGCRTGSATRPA